MSDSDPWMCYSFANYLADRGFFDGMITSFKLKEDITFEDMLASMMDEASNLDIYLPDYNDWDYEYFFHNLIQ